MAFTVNLLEVFVDDFCCMTNNLSASHLEHFSKALICGVHSVFPPPEISNHPGEDPISQKKMEEGEATWDYTKDLLGWLVDGINYTIQLSPEKCNKLAKLLTRVSHQHHCPLKAFQIVAGKLQHASFGVCGGKGLFSPIYSAMLASPPFITITPTLKSTLLDWRTIIYHLAKHPTPVRLLIPQSPNFIQYTDACFLGGGGVICPGTTPIPYVVWQFPWPVSILEKSVRNNSLLMTSNWQP